MWFGAVTLGIALAASASTPLVGVSFRHAHAATPAFELAVDCDVSAPGIQAVCNVPVPASGPRSVAVVASNSTGASVSLGAFSFDIFNPNCGGAGATTTPQGTPASSGCTGAPGATGIWPASNPNLTGTSAGFTGLVNAANFANGCPAGDYANAATGASGTSTSFLSCFNQLGGETLANGASVILGTQTYDVTMPAAGSIILTLSNVAATDDNTVSLLSCDPSSAPPVPPTGNVTGACFPGTLNFTAAPPIVDDGSGPRQEGTLIVTSSLQFDTGGLSVLDPNAQLIEDTHWDQFGVRVLVVKTLDSNLDQLIIKLQGVPGIIAAGKNWMHSLLDVAPNDPYWTGQNNAGLELINLAELWSYSTGSPNVHVAVLDTGVNEIPDLQGRVLPGKNFLDATDDTSHTDGHGTMVASVIAAAKNNGQGIAGIAPGVSIVPVKVCYPIHLPGVYGFATCPNGPILNGLWWVASQAASGSIQLVNMSLGGDPDIPGASTAIAAIHQRNVPVVVASGNNGSSPVMYPARDPNAIAVGGTWPNSDWRPDANFGADLDIAAPFQTYAMNNIDAPVYAQGTSFSAPVITGLLALKMSSDLVPEGLVLGDPWAFQTWANWMDHTPSHQVVSCSGWNQYTGCGVPWDANDLGVKFMAARRYDLNGDCIVDVADEQILALHWEATFGMPFYNVAYDLEPLSYPDLDVDIKDLQKVFSREGFRCR
jgi:subtilisin family serine protease